MAYPTWILGAAIVCALGAAPMTAHGVVVIRNATGVDATDFHIEFNNPADKLKLKSNRMGNGVTYPPPATATKRATIDFAGGAGVPKDGELKIDGLGPVKGAGPLVVTDWWWTAGRRLTGEPLIVIDGTTFTLQGLKDKNIYIAPIPEPETWAAMIMGFGTIGAVLRRRRTTAVA